MQKMRGHDDHDDCWRCWGCVMMIIIEMDMIIMMTAGDAEDAC